METPTDRSQTPQDEQRSPRWTERVVHRTAPPGTLPCLEAEVTLLGDAHNSTDPADVTCPQCKEPTRSPRTAAEPAICDPGRHVSGPWCSRCGQWFVDGEWRNTPPETTPSPELLDGRIREAVHWAQSPTMDDGTACPYAPPGEYDGSIITWTPTITIDPAQVTCAQCSNRIEPTLPPGLDEAIEAMYADGSIFSEANRDPADVHSDDAMLSAVISEGITPLTPVAEEIRVVLNRYSAEAPSGTPDYILANYLIDCLKAFNEAVSLRSVWRGEPIEQTTLHIDKEL
ncbi:MAG TPA: hypothetical protein PK478_03770 [Nitrospira sp.]|nr:hypothetical protein [Nitrospira sp.]